MRHAKKRYKLGRTASHRKATLSALSTALIRHKRITTTLTKAKALRVFVEPLITRARSDTTHNRREVFRHLMDKEAVTELFNEISVKVGDRPGGYTRVLRLGQRQGDAAEMAIIELVDYNESIPEESTPRRRRTRRSRRRRASDSGSGVVSAAGGSSARETDIAQEDSIVIDGEVIEELDVSEAPVQEPVDEVPAQEGDTEPVRNVSESEDTGGDTVESSGEMEVSDEGQALKQSETGQEEVREDAFEAPVQESEDAEEPVDEMPEQEGDAETAGDVRESEEAGEDTIESSGGVEVSDHSQASGQEEPEQKETGEAISEHPQDSETTDTDPSAPSEQEVADTEPVNSSVKSEEDGEESSESESSSGAESDDKKPPA